MVESFTWNGWSDEVIRAKKRADGRKRMINKQHYRIQYSQTKELYVVWFDN